MSRGNFLRSMAHRPVMVNRWEYEILPGGATCICKKKVTTTIVITIGSDPDESVGHSDLVKVRIFPVQEISVRPPDPR